MLKTKFQSVNFTAITAWLMVYIMTLYNTVIVTHNFTNSTFFVALNGMWIEFIIFCNLFGVSVVFLVKGLFKTCYEGALRIL